MAAENYNPVPEVAPQEQAPNDTLRVNATPAAFGGAIAQGTEALGQGAYKAGQFFGQVAADQATNNFVQQATDITTQFQALRGQAAMDAQPKVQKQIDDLLDSTRAQLTTPDQQLKFDVDSRRYRTYLGERIGSHYDQQMHVWQSSVHDQTFKTALDGIASDPDDVQHFLDSTKTAVDAAVNKARLDGTSEVEAADNAKRAAVVTRVESIGTRDPTAALGIIDKYKNTLGTEYSKVYDKFRNASDAQSGQAAGATHLAEARSSLSQHTVGQYAPALEQAARSVPGSASPQDMARFVQIESNGNPNAGAGTKHEGLVQASDGWWRDFGHGSKYDPNESINALARSTAHDRPILARVLGRDPTGAELYLAHQQGPGGAAALLANPNARAGDIVGDAAIRQNRGDPNAPASAFTDKWIAKFNGTVTPTSFAGERGVAMPTTAPGTPAESLFTPPAPESPSAPASPTAPAPTLTAPGTPASPTAPGAPASAGPAEPAAPAEEPLPAMIAINPYDKAEAAVMADKSLNYRQQTAALAQIRREQQVEQANAVDQERAIRLAKIQREEVSDNAERKVMADLYSQNPVNTVQSIVSNPQLTNAAVERMLKVANAAERVQPSPGTSHDNTLRLLSDIRRPADDPNKIQDSKPLFDALANHEINKSDFDWLSKQQQDVKTPEGERINAQQTKFTKLYSPMITKSNPLMGVSDPVGDQRLYQFEQDVDAAVQRYKAEGKNPLDLFNPAKPDFVGSPKAMAPYQTSMTESMNAKVGSIQSANAILPPVTTTLGVTGPAATPPRPSAPQPTPAADRPLRLPNESFTDYDRRLTEFLANRAAPQKIGHLVVGAP